MNEHINLLASDTLHFRSLTYVRDGPAIVLPGPGWKANFCVPKPAGKLAFTLSSARHFDLLPPSISFDPNNPVPPDPGIDIDVLFTGEQQTSAEGDMLIVWKVDQIVNRDFKTRGVTVHIDQIFGSITTRISAHLPRAKSSTCDAAAPRSIGVDLTTFPGENKITVHGDVNGIGGAISIENITLVAHAAQVFEVNAKIEPVRDSCGIGGIAPGGVARFWAKVTSPSAATTTYRWSVTGSDSVPLGSTIGARFDVQLGNSTGPIDVQLEVTVEGVSTVAFLRYFPDTERTAQVKNFICELHFLLRRNLFVDPLWDPLRDYIRRPLDRQEILRMQKFATELLEQTTRLLRHVK